MVNAHDMADDYSQVGREDSLAGDPILSYLLLIVSLIGIYYAGCIVIGVAQGTLRALRTAYRYRKGA